jgi:hypothetical protein
MMLANTDLKWLQPILNFLIWMFDKFPWPVAIFIIFLLSGLIFGFVFIWFYLIIGKMGNKKTNVIVNQIQTQLNSFLMETKNINNNLDYNINILNKFLFNFSENDTISLHKLYLGSSVDKDFTYFTKNLIFNYFDKIPSRRVQKDFLLKELINGFENLYLNKITKWIYNDIQFRKKINDNTGISVYDIFSSFILNLNLFEEREKLYYVENVNDKNKEHIIFNNLRRDLENSISDMINEVDKILIDILKMDVIVFIKNNPDTKFIIEKENI